MTRAGDAALRAASPIASLLAVDEWIVFVVFGRFVGVVAAVHDRTMAPAGRWVLPLSSQGVGVPSFVQLFEPPSPQNLSFLPVPFKVSSPKPLLAEFVPLDAAVIVSSNAEPMMWSMWFSSSFGP